MFHLEIKTIGNAAQIIHVYLDGLRAPAKFYDRRDAEVAAKIVEKYNSNSAFEYVRIV